MPQMSPMSWFLMFCVFSSILLTLINKMFHIYTNMISNQDIDSDKKYYIYKTWKW